MKVAGPSVPVAVHGCAVNMHFQFIFLLQFIDGCTLLIITLLSIFGVTLLYCTELVLFSWYFCPVFVHVPLCKIKLSLSLLIVTTMI